MNFQTCSLPDQAAAPAADSGRPRRQASVKASGKISSGIAEEGKGEGGGAKRSRSKKGGDDDE